MIIASPPDREFKLSQLVGRGHRAGGKGGAKGGGLLGQRGQGEKGKGKEAIISETCGHLGGQGENGESPAVQSGRALPMGRCARSPWASVMQSVCTQKCLHSKVHYRISITGTVRLPRDLIFWRR